MSITKSRQYDYWVFWGTCLGYVLFAAYIFVSYSGNKTLHNRYVNRAVAGTIYHGRWNLYTATITGPVCKLYTVDNGKAVLFDLHPFALRFLFGLKRDSKIITEEMIVIMSDTALLNKTVKYQVTVPVNDDINKYLKADTLKFTPYVSDNVKYLKGKILITSEALLTWQQVRSGAVKNKVINVTAVNIMQ